MWHDLMIRTSPALPCRRTHLRVRVVRVERYPQPLRSLRNRGLPDGSHVEARSSESLRNERRPGVSSYEDGLNRGAVARHALCVQGSGAVGTAVFVGKEAAEHKKRAHAGRQAARMKTGLLGDAACLSRPKGTVPSVLRCLSIKRLINTKKGRTREDRENKYTEVIRTLQKYM